jgi:hypothetical protein
LDRISGIAVAPSGPALVLTGAALGVFGRHLSEAIYRGWTVRDAAAPHDLLEVAMEIDKLTGGTSGTTRSRVRAGQVNGAEPRNSRRSQGAGRSGQPARTVSVKQAAAHLEVSESYVRRLVRHEVLEVQAGQRPTQIFADSVAAYREQRSRKGDNDSKAA